MNKDQEMNDVLDEILKEMVQTEHQILYETSQMELSHHTSDLETSEALCPSQSSEANEDIERECDSDEDLMNIISQMKTKVIVIGIGGAGSNILSRLYDSGAPFVETLAINTDAQDLFSTNSTKKLLIGKKVTYGFGTGNDPEKGRLAAEQDKERILPFVKKDIVILLCGLGGGTGSGAAPVIAEYAKENGAVIISICTLPFQAEGKQKELIAYKSLHGLARFSDALIPMPNNTITSLIPNIGMLEGFKIMDELIGKNLRAITDLVSRCGMINLDLADIKNVFDTSISHLEGEVQAGFLTVGEIPLSVEDSEPQFSLKSLNKYSKDKIHRATVNILKNQINRIDPSKIDRCLISITGPPKMTILEINEIVDSVTRTIKEDAILKFGTIIDPSLDRIQIAILARGPKSDYIAHSEELFGPINRMIPSNRVIHRDFILRRESRTINPKIKISEPAVPASQGNIEVEAPKINVDHQISERALKTHFRLKASSLLSSSHQSTQNEINRNNYFNAVLKRRFENPVQIQDDSQGTIKKVVDFVL